MTRQADTQNPLMRWVLVASSLVVLVGLTHVGRDVMEQRRIREAAASATALANRIDEAETSGVAVAAPDAKNALEELKALDGLIKASPSTSVALEQTKKVAADLRTLLDRPSNEQVLADIQQRIRALDEGALTTQLKQAADAVTSALAPPATSSPSRASADNAVSKLCNAAGGSLGAARPRVCDLHTKPREAEALETLSDRRAKAELEVARYRLAVATTDDAEKALAVEVESKEAAYAEAVREHNEGVAGVDAAEAMQVGAGAVVAALPWIGDAQGDVPVRLDVIGWVLLGVIALLAYRWLEQRAAARALGPVAVEGKEESDVERFRTYVLRNIPDPGAVPGAAALQPVTDLLAATQLPTIVGKVVSAIVAALGQKHGYTVSFEVFGATKDQPSTKASPGQLDASTPIEIAVRVNKARSGELVDQKVVQDKARDDALRKAAYWAAAVVLQRSDRVPRWAQWSSETSDSLAVFFSEADLRQRELRVLEDAVGRAPTSGVLCLQLSNAYALESQNLAAFELALRAASLYPNFVAACYAWQCPPALSPPTSAQTGGSSHPSNGNARCPHSSDTDRRLRKRSRRRSRRAAWILAHQRSNCASSHSRNSTTSRSC